VNGIVDESMRALLDVCVAASKDSPMQVLTAWIDTAFNGGLVIPRKDVERLGLRQASTTQAILADGHPVELETFTCHLDWFGNTYRTQVVSNEGPLPLLGTLLLAGRKLTIDYKNRKVVLE
jgi:clan AA aspartic protease